MLACQIDYKAFMAAGKTAAATEAAKRADVASHFELNKLRAMPENSECFDCTATKPGWAALPHGVFVCIDCAQQHRSIGRHVSQTKAVNTGTYLWHPAEIAVMQAVGNKLAARAWASSNLPPKPSRDAPAAEKLAYAKAKYEGVPGPDWSCVGDAPHNVGPPPSAPAPSPPLAVLNGEVRRVDAAARPSKPATLKGAVRARVEPSPPPQAASPVVADLISFDDEPVAVEMPAKQPAPATDAQFFAQWGL